MFKSYKNKIYNLFNLVNKIEKISIDIKKIELNLDAESRENNYFRRFLLSINGRLNSPIFPGNWAGDFAFFYTLSRVLNDFKFKKILELGAGQSTIFINDILRNSDVQHYIVEHDEVFIEKTKVQLNDCNKVNFIKTDLLKRKVSDEIENFMYRIEDINVDEVDLLIVDGPFGSDFLSRFEIVELVRKNIMKEDFVIFLDDSQRLGEKQTLDILLSEFDRQNKKVYIAHYYGSKRVSIIGTEKYKLIQSL